MVLSSRRQRRRGRRSANLRDSGDNRLNEANPFYEFFIFIHDLVFKNNTYPNIHYYCYWLIVIAYLSTSLVILGKNVSTSDTNTKEQDLSFAFWVQLSFSLCILYCLFIDYRVAKIQSLF